MDTNHSFPAAPLDVLVIGAGQAGLAIGYHLQQRGLSFLLVDGASRIGASWRSRWDSLRLFTPAEFDALPGTPFPAPVGTYPGKDQVADYLESYVQVHRLPVRLGTRVTRLERDGDGFRATTSVGELHARQVVVATGPFQRPFVPEVSAGLAPDVPQLHSAEYRNPRQLPHGARVLVVGAANSGLQIAEELAATHRITLAVGSRVPQLPQRLLGRDLFFWLSRMGLLRMSSHSRLARRIRARGDVVIGSSIGGLRRRGGEVRPRLTSASGRVAQFADGSTVEFDAVIWATGYRPDYRWLDVEGALVGGEVHHVQGRTEVPGLYFLGLPWQTTRGSALLGFVAADAEQISALLQDGIDEWSSARAPEVQQIPVSTTTNRK